MSSFRALLHRLRGLFRRRSLDRDMNEELRAHLDGLIERNLAAGMSGDDARYAALRAFGGVEPIKERARDERRSVWGEQLLQDLRYAARQLWKTPGFTCVAVLSLALGIGANTALFSVIDDVLLRSLPVHDPDKLVLFRWVAGPNGLPPGLTGAQTPEPASSPPSSTLLAYFIFERLREQSDVFSDLFAFLPLNGINMTADHQAERIRGQVVTGGYFQGLGVSALRGRVLTESDDRTDAPVAVISHRFWQSRFGGDAGVIGRTIRLNARAVMIVGVTPRDFNGTLQAGESPDVTLPIATYYPDVGRGVDARGRPWNRKVHVMARLQRGVTAQEALARSEPIFLHAAHEAWLAASANAIRNPEPANFPTLRLEPGRQGLVDARRTYAMACSRTR